MQFLSIEDAQAQVEAWRIDLTSNAAYLKNEFGNSVPVNRPSHAHPHLALPRG